MTTDHSAARPDVILAGASVRSIAESAFRDGLVPYCLDMFSDADLKRRVQHETGCAGALVHQISCLEEALGHLHRLPANVPIIVCGGLEHSLKAECEELKYRQVAGPAPSVIEDVTRPDVLFPLLQEQGIAIPQWRTSDRTPGAGRWLRKRMQSSGGTGVHLWSEKLQSESPRDSIPSDVYFQQWLEGTAASATFLASPIRKPSAESESCATLLGVSAQLCGVAALNACEFQFCGNAGPIRPTRDLRRQLQRMGEVVAENWVMNGVFGIDFILHHDTAFLIEINPRITASHEIHEWSNPELRGHVSLHLSPEQTIHALHRSSSSADTSVAGGHHRWARSLRLIIYAASDVVVDPDIQSRLFSLEGSSTCRVGDIPSVGTTVRRGTPACSFYSEFGTSLSRVPLDLALSPFLANAHERLEETINQTRDKIQKLESG